MPNENEREQLIQFVQKGRTFRQIRSHMRKTGLDAHLGQPIVGTLMLINNDLEIDVDRNRQLIYSDARFLENHPPSANLIERLNRDFTDIVIGEVRQTEPLSAESNDANTLHLHRLLMRFNREDYARLRQMIDVINDDKSTQG